MEIFDRILYTARKDPNNIEAFRDALSFCKNIIKKSGKSGLSYTTKLKALVGETIKKGVNIATLHNLYFDILVVETPYSLDSYFQALEFNRPTQEKFYLPRRKQLYKVVKVLEDLLINDKLDEAFLSEPPRVGKTTTVVYGITWLIGMNPDMTNLYCSASGGQCNSFYKGVYDILMDSDTYNWHKIFPSAKFDPNSFCNAKETYLDIGKIKRYHSFTARSIDAENLNGSCDCNGLMVADDLCASIEEALNPERLKNLWLKVSNNLLPRGKMGSKRLWIGTRWSLVDPIGIRRKMLESGENAFSKVRFAVVDLPALNENDESNFDYLYGVGFDTNFYKEVRARFEMNDDVASWLAQYQCTPIERAGQLFAPNSLNYYEELPCEEDGTTKTPDRIFAFCDVALGGGDYLSFPVGYEYGKEVYIEDWVFDNGDKDITRPKVLNAILRNKVQASMFEANNGGEQYQEWIAKELKEKYNYSHNITSRYADSTTKKENRIFDTAPDIKREFYFKAPHKQNAEYKKAMANLFSYQVMQNNKHKHDDAPDSLRGLQDMRIIKAKTTSFEVFTRPF